MLQAAEGGMAIMDNVLVRMRELAEQASTGRNHGRGALPSGQRGLPHRAFTRDMGGLRAVGGIGAGQNVVQVVQAQKQRGFSNPRCFDSYK